MFLLRKPIRKETDVFDLHDTYQLEAYNYLLARDGLDLKIIEQKEYSVKGGPGFDDQPGTPDALYMRVTYELLNENYEPRRPGTRAQVDKVRGSGKKKASGPAKKRPKVITRDQLNAKDIAAANGIQFEDGKPVIDVDASTPAEPPKVVALDLYRAADAEAQGKKQKQDTKKDPKKPSKPRKPKDD